MRGSKVEARPGVWHLRAYVGKDTHGKPIQTRRTYRGGARGAEDALRKLVAEVEKSRSKERHLTVGALLARWLDHIAPERTPSTITGYRAKVVRRLIPALGTTRIDKLGPELLDRTYRQWQTEGLSPASIRQLHAILSAALHQAVKWGWLGDNPTARASPPAIHKRATGIIPAEDLRRIIAEAERSRDGVLPTAIALAALTGCRRGELCALRWSDVTLTDEFGVLRVERSLTVIGQEATVGPTKTHQARRLALDPWALEVLARRRSEQEAQARAQLVELTTDPWILSRRADGSTPCLPHGLTHGFASLCISLGMTVPSRRGERPAASVAFPRPSPFRSDYKPGWGSGPTDRGHPARSCRPGVNDAGIRTCRRGH
jgi:integrase